jgi:transcriptional regulator with XRE-family HTH domain
MIKRCNVLKVYIAEIRLRKKISLRELSRLTKITKSTLGNIESQKYSPRLLQLETIARAMNVRMTELFDSDIK